MNGNIENIKEMVEKAGSAVGIDSDACTIHRTQHDNCSGCEYEIGCCKLTTMGLLFLTAAAYKPKSFEDYLETSRITAGLAKNILEAKSKEAIKGVLSGVL